MFLTDTLFYWRIEQNFNVSREVNHHSGDHELKLIKKDVVSTEKNIGRSGNVLEKVGQFFSRGVSSIIVICKTKVMRQSVEKQFVNL